MGNRPRLTGLGPFPAPYYNRETRSPPPAPAPGRSGRAGLREFPVLHFSKRSLSRVRRQMQRVEIKGAVFRRDRAGRAKPRRPRLVAEKAGADQDLRSGITVVEGKRPPSRFPRRRRRPWRRDRAAVRDMARGAQGRDRPAPHPRPDQVSEGKAVIRTQAHALGHEACDPGAKIARAGADQERVDLAGRPRPPGASASASARSGQARRPRRETRR